MKTRAFFGAVCVIMLILGCARQLTAQAGPGTFADANLPSGAPDPQKEDSIWQVDPLTGALNVKIPFTTTPVGGRGPRIPFSLLYNSSSTVTLQTGLMYTIGGGEPSVSCSSTAASMNICLQTDILDMPDMLTPTETIQSYIWAPGNVNSPSGPVGPWTTSGPFLYNSYSQLPDQIFTVNPGNGPVTVNDGYGCTVWGPYLYADEDGAVHDMNVERVSYNGSQDFATMSYACGLAYYNTQQTSMPQGISSDGSSLIALGLNAGVTGVVYPDGTKFTPGPDPWVYSATGLNYDITSVYNGSVSLLQSLEDTNGNISSLTNVYSNGYFTFQDSEGRTPYTTNIPIGRPGPVPAGGDGGVPGTPSAGNYSVVTKDAYGNTETYSVNFATFSTTESFTMQHPANNEITVEVGCINGISCPTMGYEALQPEVGINNSSTMAMNIPAVTSIGLPNGTSYIFQYDPMYGSINKIIFPTGGYVRFVYGVRPNETGYGTFEMVSSIVVTDVFVSDPINGEDHWNYSYSPNVPGSSMGFMTSVVTAPDNTTTTYSGTPFSLCTFFCDGVGGTVRPSWKPATVQIKNSSGLLVKSVATSYTGQGLPTQIATTLYDGPSPLQSQTDFVYDQWNNVIEKDESDFNVCTAPCTPPVYPAAPSGGWLRRTFTTYQYQNNSAWLAAHIVNKPSQVLVTDGAGHPYSLVQYGYDETAVSGSAGYVNHDDTNYGPTSVLPRGNLTSERHCKSLNALTTFTSASAAAGAASACNGAWLTTTHTYDLTGQVLSTTEPNGSPYTTTYTYTDNYVNGIPPGPTNGYLTKVTHPYGYTDNYSYNYSSGQMATHTDWNSQPTQYYYNDLGGMSRLTETKYPDNGDVLIRYYDSAPPSITVTTKTGTASPSIVRTTQYDELGRVAQTQLTSDPSGTDFVNTTYDSMGRVQSVTNPFRTTSDPTYGITSYLYDPLSRKRYQCQPDNSSTPSTICVPTNSYQTWTYRGNCVVFQDENKNQWQRCSNGLGQMISVQEPSSIAQAPSMATNYSYDPLNNLLSVAQLGGPTATGITRNRAFTYDSLSRLMTSFNPENGTVSYSYDANSNVQNKTDARGVTTTYLYDHLNRLYSKTYSYDASNTPASCYQYDLSSVCNGIGRLTNQWTQSSSAGTCLAPTGGFLTMRSILCYDPMGRILSEQQFTPASQASGMPYVLAYTYDWSGNLLSSTSGAGPAATPANPNPITFTSTFDGAGRLQTLMSSWTNNNVFPPTLFSPPATGQSTPCVKSFTTQYAPHGGLANAAYGIPANVTVGVLTLNRAYDNRLRTTCETDTGTGTTPATSGSATVTITGSEQTK